MKLVHHITLSVFSKEHEDHAKLADALAKLVPFNITEQKIELEKQIAIGFNESKIRIFKILLKTQRHTNAFIDFIKKNLTEDQKNLLLVQIDSRLDKENVFFIRFDKDNWLNNNELTLIDDGNCFHVKMSIATFPSSREKAKEVVKNLFHI